MSVLHQALVILVNLWLTRFTLHRIGERDYGLWLIGGQFAMYLSLLDLGVTALLPREVARATGENAAPEARDAAVRQVIGNGASAVVWLLVPIALTSVGMLALLPADWSALRGPLAISLACLCVTYPLRIAQSSLTGLQALAYVNGVETVAWVLGVGATVAFIEAGFGLYAVAAGPAVGQLASAGACIWRLTTRYRGLLPRRFRWLGPSELFKQLKSSTWVSVSQVAHLLLNGTDVIVIARLLGPTAVLPYTFTDRAESLLNNQPYSVASLAGPAMSELRGSGDLSRLVGAVRAVCGVVLVLSGGIVVAVLAGNHAFVRLWVGEDHFGGMPLTTLLLVNMLAGHFSFTFGSTLVYCGYERATALLSVFNGVLGTTLSIVLVRRLGIIGAPLGALIAISVTQVPAFTVMLARELGTSVRELLRTLGPWSQRFVPIALLAWLVGSRLDVHSYVAIGAAAGGLVVLYGAATLPLLRRPPLDVYAAPYLAKLDTLRRSAVGWFARDRRSA
jgi:O-antigen/teichoic acid export membrane protein